MPRQSKSTQSKSANVTEPVAVPVVAPVAEPVPAPVVTPAPPVVEQEPATVPAKKPRASRKKTEEQPPATPATPQPEPQAPAQAQAPEAVVEEPATEPATKSTRAVVTRESVMTEFSELVSMLEEHILKLRDSTDKSNGVKFLRTVGKRVKTLQTNTARVLRQKQPSSRKNNNAGFLKPVKISGEMSNFTGLDPSGLHSRVDVTKFLCSYIKEHNLQNPADKRQIIADPALCKLLSYDPNRKDEKPLTYYHLQSLLKSHFTKSA